MTMSQEIALTVKVIGFGLILAFLLLAEIP